MPIQPLAPTDAQARPAFRDAAACRKWQAQLQLANLPHAHAQLHAQLEELNRFDMPYLMRFQTLETLRETVVHLRDENDKKLAGRPLPLSELEHKMLVAMVQLWQAMAAGYQRCLEAAGQKDKKLSAMFCQRCLHCNGSAILEYLRNGYESDPALWSQLHSLYAYSEEQQLHRTAVKAGPGGQQVTNCRDTYVKFLLANYAHPAGLTLARQHLLDRWLDSWSSEVGVEAGYSMSKGDAPPLAVDISGSAGLQPVRNTVPGATMRYLAMVPLSKLLRIKLILLQQNKSPQQVGLGDEASGSECVSLLTLLHRSLCEEDAIRLTESQKLEHPAQLYSAFGDIYHALSGRMMPHAGPSDDAMSAEKRENESPALPEHWLADNESLLNVRCTRMTGVTRMNARQLVGLRAENSSHFKLGMVTWLQQSFAGRLQAGVSFLPGEPEPVGISTIGANKVELGDVSAAFLLPALGKLQIPASLIVPRDWFHAGREIELLHATGTKECVRMGIRVERGRDFERVSFTPV